MPVVWQWICIVTHPIRKLASRLDQACIWRGCELHVKSVQKQTPSSYSYAGSLVGPSLHTTRLWAARRRVQARIVCNSGIHLILGSRGHGSGLCTSSQPRFLRLTSSPECCPSFLPRCNTSTSRLFPGFTQPRTYTHGID